MNTTITKLAAEMTRLRKLACKHDGIDPTASFFILSDTNPHAEAYNTAVGKWLDARKLQANSIRVG